MCSTTMTDKSTTTTNTDTTTNSTNNTNINNQISFIKIKQELQSQCSTSIPTILGLIFYKLPWMISLHFVGEIGPGSLPLASAALATTLCNVTGLSFSVGLSSAISTLTGQARGHLLKKGHEMDIRMMKMKEEEEVGEVEFGIGIGVRNNDIRRKQKNNNNNNHDHDPNHNQTSFVNIMEEKKTETETETETETTPLLLMTAQNTITDENQNQNQIEDNECGYNSTEKHDIYINHNDNNDNNNEPLLPLVFLYRGILIQLSIVIPIGIWWINGIESTLLFLGQEEHLSLMTTMYLRVLTPGLWSYSINWTTTAWLQSIEMADVPAYASFVGFILHIPFNILYVKILHYGYLGVAMATVSFQILQPLLIYIYLFGTQNGRERILVNTGAKAVGRDELSFWPEFYTALFSLSGIKQYLGLGLPGMVAISEWWASECCIFLSGRLTPNPDYALGAMSIYQSINTFFFMFPIGFSTAASSRVGMFLGKNQPKKAHLASTLSLGCAGFVSLTMGMILFFTPHTFFPSFFTSDDNVIVQTSYTITFLAFYVFADGLQVGLQGTIKACGKQYVMAPIVIFSYWVIGVPLSYFNTFVKNDGVMDCIDGSICGVRGLIFGLLTGTWIHMLLLLAVVVFTIDWDTEAFLAQKRMAIHSEREDSNDERSKHGDKNSSLEDDCYDIDAELPKPLYQDGLRAEEKDKVSEPCSLKDVTDVGASIESGWSMNVQEQSLQVNHTVNGESETVTEFDDESLSSLANTVVNASIERSGTNGDFEGNK